MAAAPYVKCKPCRCCAIVKVTPFVICVISISNMKCIQASLLQNFKNNGMEELNDLYTSPIIVRMMNSRRLRWAGHVAHGGEKRCLQDFGGET